jgi:hypothetical protein
LASVICSCVYVPGGAVAVPRMVVKPVKRAKSTVAGAVGVISATGAPPPWGTRLAEVIVATKDSTSQTGASVPKATTEPAAGGGPVPVPGPLRVPHPAISAAAKMMRSPEKIVQYR